jgi:mannitol/fructose-specific phosphotransferase system IIA component (Ntr-type)
MKVFELLKPEFILNGFSSDGKDEIINEMINLFRNDERVTSIEDVRKCVFERG